MSNKIVLNQIELIENRISYKYTVTGECINAFRTQHEYFLEYGYNVTECPYSVAVVPFLGNVLPIAWVMDAEIIIESIDEDFLYSIDEVKRGYQRMFPKIDFKGKLSYVEKVKNTIGDGNGAMLYFSGGIDANASIVSTIAEKPLLVTIWGTDVFLNDIDGWKKLEEIGNETAKLLDLGWTYIKSSFRNVLNYDYLNMTYAKPNGDNWWHGFQHGIALITLGAPLAYVKKIRKLYFSSSYSVYDKTEYTCASHPAIDNNVHFCDCRAIHEGFENTRLDKIRKIGQFYSKSKTKPRLHVCWVTRTGENCCECEKCARTIFGMLAEGYNPNEFGFPLTDEKYDKIVKLIEERKIPIYPVFWESIISKLSKNEPLIETNRAVQYMVSKYGTDRLEEKFFPTVLSEVKNEKDKLVMFRSFMESDFVDEKDKFMSVGMNTGNAVFTAALEKELGLEIMPYHMMKKNGIRPKAVISTDLIWITPDANFEYLVKQIEELKDIPVVPISVGVQAASLTTKFKLSESVERALKMIQEKAVIGVRGDYTASILEKHGIRNIQVIGCPSLYYVGSKGYQFSKDNLKPLSVACNFRSLYGKLSVKEKHFLSYCATRNFTFYEQTSQPFSLENAGNDQKYFEYVNRWMQSKRKLYFEVEQWKKDLCKANFSIGARFHGNVIALWNNIPSLFITLDSRTQELVDFFNLPSISMEKFDWNKPIEYYYDLADYSIFSKNYAAKYNNFTDFLKKNGLLVKDETI